MRSQTLISLFAALALAFSSCANPKPTPPPAAIATTTALEMRLEVAPGETPAAQMDYEGRTLRLGPPVRFDLERLYVTSDALGRPAVGFELTEEAATRLRDWTRSSLNRGLAVVVGDKIITHARIVSELSGRGILQGGSRGFTAERCEEIIAELEER